MSHCDTESNSRDNLLKVKNEGNERGSSTCRVVPNLMQSLCDIEQGLKGLKYEETREKAAGRSATPAWASFMNVPCIILLAKSSSRDHLTNMIR
jgi:hypothetical protein